MFCISPKILAPAGNQQTLRINLQPLNKWLNEPNGSAFYAKKAANRSGQRLEAALQNDCGIGSGAFFW